MEVATLLENFGLPGLFLYAIWHLYQKQNKNHQECIEDRKKLWDKYNEQRMEIIALKNELGRPCEKVDCPRLKTFLERGQVTHDTEDSQRFSISGLS